MTLQASRWQRPTTGGMMVYNEANIALLQFNTVPIPANPGAGSAFDMANVNRAWNFYALDTVTSEQALFGAGSFRYVAPSGGGWPQINGPAEPFASSNVDFTIEMAIRPTAIGSATDFIWSSVTHAIYIRASDNLVGVWDVFGQGFIVGTQTVNLGAWNRVALTHKQSTNTWRLFVNGVLALTRTDFQSLDRNGAGDSVKFGPGAIGTQTYFSRPTAHIDECVMVWDKCIYNANYTPRASAWTVPDLIAAPAL